MKNWQASITVKYCEADRKFDTIPQSPVENYTSFDFNIDVAEIFSGFLRKFVRIRQENKANKRSMRVS